MLTKLLLMVAGVCVIAVCAYLGLAVYSHRTPTMGLVQGKLRPCPDRPNCVVSEGTGAAIEALALAGDPESGWARFAASVTAAGGMVRRDQGGYLHATFESRWLRFVDDLEARLDAEAGVIHVRSAARVGYSDRGFNAARVERLRAAVRSAR